MARTCRTPEQVIRALLQADELEATGMTGSAIAAKLGVSEATVYNWRKRYRDMDVDAAKELTALKDENAKLTRIAADQMLRIDALEEITKGQFSARHLPDGQPSTW